MYEILEGLCTNNLNYAVYYRLPYPFYTHAFAPLPCTLILRLASPFPKPYLPVAPSLSLHSTTLISSVLIIRPRPPVPHNRHPPHHHRWCDGARHCTRRRGDDRRRHVRRQREDARARGDSAGRRRDREQRARTRALREDHGEGIGRCGQRCRRADRGGVEHGHARLDVGDGGEVRVGEGRGDDLLFSGSVGGSLRMEHWGLDEEAGRGGKGTGKVTYYIVREGCHFAVRQGCHKETIVLSAAS